MSKMIIIILCEFEIQTDHLIPDLKNGDYQGKKTDLMDFAVLSENKRKDWRILEPC